MSMDRARVGDFDGIEITDHLLPGVSVVPDDVYFAHPALSQSGAKLLLPPSCPALFRWERDHPSPPKRVFDFGHAAHAEVLGVAGTYAVIPDDLLASNGAASTAAAKAFIADCTASGVAVIKSSEAEQVWAMADAIRGNADVMRLMGPGRAEVAMLWADADTGVELRCKVDWLPDDRSTLVDYKTAVSAGPAWFRRHYTEFGYHQQAAWYIDAAIALGLHDDPDFVFLVQQKTPPYLVQPYRLSVAALAAGRELNRRAIRIFADCTATGVWPGYAGGVATVDLPDWYETPAPAVDVEVEWWA